VCVYASACLYTHNPIISIMKISNLVVTIICTVLLLRGIKTVLSLHSMYGRHYFGEYKQTFAATNLTKDYSKMINLSKLKVYVLSLQGVSGSHPNNNDRFDKFSDALQKQCGHDVHIEFCPGVINKIRGQGTQKGFLNCFTKALSDQHKYLVFMEDDARLRTSEFCNDSYRDSLWAAVRSDVFMILLGGHHISIIPFQTKKKFTKVVSSYGSYGFMITRENVKHLYSYYAWELSLDRPTYSPDLSLFTIAAHLKKSVQITTPTVVYHIAGFSNTWQKSRDQLV